MKLSLIAILLSMTLSGSSCKAQTFQFNKDHYALLVKDLEKAAAFYSDILGLKEIDNAGLGERFRWFELSDKVQIHLILNDTDVQKDKNVHIALNVDDLDGFMAFLVKKNVHFENWTGDPRITNTRPDGIRQIYLQDPDGYWIEVNDNKL